MKKHVKEIILILSVIVCSVIALKYSRAVVVSMQQNRLGAETESAAETVSENTDLNDKTYINEEFFYEHAEDQGINRSEADKYWEMLLADDVFKNDTMQLTGLVIDDMDGNGQNDLLVMIIDRENWAIYGFGCVWIYMNEDEPYCFDAENGSYYGYFDFFAEDIDNDGNAELVLCTHGWGTGLEDICKVIFKYKNHNLEQMELPSDLETDYDQGICVEVYQEEEKDRYSAYCPYFDEKILFEAENVVNPDGLQINAGSNVRGFYNLSPVKYQGKNALQASEYLSGEGGTIHYVATAQFIILWDENGHSYVDRWWIEAKENTYANSKGCRITYADGYYYYASQLDHYYLYRVKEDGSEAVCLAKVHPGTIQVDGDCIYFVNLSDHNAIYRIGTDGSGMVRLCDSSDNHMQLTEEYIYFRSAYEKEWDIHGLVSDETDAAAYYGTDGCLYRMHKDGSEKELLLVNVRNCILAPVSGSEIKYEGHIYCGKSQQNETTGQNETHVMVYDLDGNSIGEVCRFDFKGDILVCGGRIYCYSLYEENVKICMYTTWDKEMTTLPDKMLTDCCIYKGSLYGLTEEIDQEKRITQIYRLSPDTEEWQMVYSNNAFCTAADGHGDIYNRGSLADLYATEQGVFLRQFVSSKEGVRWFAVGEEKDAVSWEDETQIPITQLAFELDHTGELSSIKSDFHSTDGYEEYLMEDLTYEAFYSKDYEGEDCNPYTIRLPQFNEKIAGYRQINQYFQNAYQESMEILQAEFVEMLDEVEKETGYLSPILYEGTAYDYVYIGEKYITVAMFQHGYSGGGRTWAVEKPVTFERDTGKVVSLEDLYRMPTDDVVAQTTAMVYKYMETIGRGGGTGSHGNGNFFLKDGDILTERYDPKQFFLFPEGIGFYYQKYTIDCGAAGDYLFIVPFADS